MSTVGRHGVIVVRFRLFSHSIPDIDSFGPLEHIEAKGHQTGYNKN